MRRIAIIAAAVTMLLTTLPAGAQAREQGDGRGRDDRRGDERRGDERREGGGREDRQPRYDPRPDARRGSDPRNEPPPYLVQPRSWRQGERLPPMYRDGYVRDPGRYRLRPAPPGYDWVGVGPDIYLVQRSTGMVLDSIPGGF